MSLKRIIQPVCGMVEVLGGKTVRPANALSCDLPPSGSPCHTHCTFSNIHPLDIVHLLLTLCVLLWVAYGTGGLIEDVPPLTVLQLLPSLVAGEAVLSAAVIV